MPTLPSPNPLRWCDMRMTALATALMLGICSACAADRAATVGAPEPTTSAPPATSSARTTTTSAPPPATSAAPTTVGPPPKLCGIQAADPKATKTIGVYHADLAGDGAPDVLSTYVVGTGGPGRWHLRIQFVPNTAGDENGQIDYTLPDDPEPGTFEILAAPYIGPGTVGIDEDRRPTIVAQIGSGASAKVLGLFRLSGCTIVPVTDPQGGIFGATVGAGVNLGSGVRCEGVSGHGLFVTVESAADPAGGYELVETAYTRAGNGLSVYGTGEQTRKVATLDGTSIGRVDCGGGKKI